MGNCSNCSKKEDDEDHKSYNMLNDMDVKIRQKDYLIELLSVVVPRNFLRPMSHFKKTYIIKKNHKCQNDLFYNLQIIQNMRSKRLFILKQIRKSEIVRIGFENFKNAITNELKIYDTIKHPNLESLIAIYYEQFNEELVIYIIVNYCSKMSLLDYMNDHIKQKKKIDEKDLCIILKVLVHTVHKLKQFNIIHRNINPESIYIVNPNNLYTISIRNFYFSTVNSSFVKGLCGSLWYMAPEMIKESEYDYSVDIWSLGIVFYMLITLENPFKHTTSKEEMLEALRNENCFKTIKKLVKLGHNQDCVKLIKDMVTDDNNKRGSFENLLDNPFFSSDDKIEETRRKIAKYFEKYNNLESIKKMKILYYKISNLPKLHEIVLYLVYNLRDYLVDIDELTELNEIFKFLDINNDGQISREEIKVSIEKLFSNNTMYEDYSNLIFKIIDTKFRSKFVKKYLIKQIDYDYFIVGNILLLIYFNDNRIDEKISIIMKELDRDESKTISMDEIRYHFTGKYDIDIKSDLIDISNDQFINKSLNFDSLNYEELKGIFLYDFIRLKTHEEDEINQKFNR